MLCWTRVLRGGGGGGVGGGGWRPWVVFPPPQLAAITAKPRTRTAGILLIYQCLPGNLRASIGWIQQLRCCLAEGLRLGVADQLIHIAVLYADVTTCRQVVLTCWLARIGAGRLA